MTSCSEWTGVLLSTLLKECGLKGSATWFVAEGAEEVKGASSMPIAKAMDDCIIAYGRTARPCGRSKGFHCGSSCPASKAFSIRSVCGASRSSTGIT